MRRRRRWRCIHKAHKWFVTRADLDYTALWILYAATPLAQIEIISRGLLADREVVPQAMALNPEFFTVIYTEMLNSKKTTRAVHAALDAIDAYVGERAELLFAPIVEYLREAGEARSASEIETSFHATVQRERRDDGVRVPGGSGTDRQGLDRGASHQEEQRRRAGAGLFRDRRV